MNAWSIQVVGKAIFDRNRVASSALDPFKDIPGAMNGSHSIFLFATPLQVLPLPSTASKSSGVGEPAAAVTFKFATQLPKAIPPSYSGRGVKFVYLVEVAPLVVAGEVSGGAGVRQEVVQRHRIGAELKLPFVVAMQCAALVFQPQMNPPMPSMRIPCGLKPVLECTRWPPVPSGDDGDDGAAAPSGGKAEEDAAGVDNGPASSAPGYSPALTSQQSVQGQSGMRPMPRTYNISKTKSVSGKETDVHVVRCTMAKRAFMLGDVVRGQLDFSGREVACYRVLVTLEQVETLDEDLLLRGCAAETRRVLWSHHEYCLHAESAGFEFSLPLEGTPNFKCASVLQVQWVLRFQFIIGSGSADAAADPTAFLDSDPEVESLEWVLPLRVHPSPPSVLRLATSTHANECSVAPQQAPYFSDDLLHQHKIDLDLFMQSHPVWKTLHLVDC